jgi:lipid-binding SYLF domain-containing protein
MRFFSRMLPFLLIALLVLGLVMPGARAASGAEIDVRVDDTLKAFRQQVKGADAVLKDAKGVLVMPRVFKAGIGLGGEYGEGALRVGGKTVDYYNIVAASYGFQLGAQKKSIILVFLDEKALQNFRDSEGWTAGVDASVALIKIGKAGELDIAQLNKPVVAFVFGQKGLMYNLSLEGSKFTKIKK